MKKLKKEIMKWNVMQMQFFRKIELCILMYAALAPVPGVGAAEAKWDAVMNFILPWIGRLGGAIALIGGVEFGIAFKSDDAEAKTRGMRTLLAGCIVIAVGLSSNIFLS